MYILPSSSHLLVVLYGRLGNNIVQCINSIAACHIHKVKTIIYDFCGWGNTDDNLAVFLKDYIILPSGLSIHPYDSKLPHKDHLFMIGDPGLYILISKALQDSDMCTSIQKDVIHLLRNLFGSPQSCESADHGFSKKSPLAVIHLRGDDVFGKGVVSLERIPSNYVQPPLSFYLNSIEHILATRDCRFVVISQDSLNPVLIQLANYLETCQIGDIFTALPLSRTLELIRSADYLISSRGTFIPSLLFSSFKHPDVYFFRDVELGYLSTLSQLFYRSHIIYDQLSRYIQQGEWMNLSFQHKMMLKYPCSALSSPHLATTALLSSNCKDNALDASHSA
jgi:hypothetical protein